MTLDRESIERRDFPVGKGGYDPAAVDAHLTALADEVEELRRGSPHSQTTLAGAVSEQVRGILEAAQHSAEDILRSAEIEAQEIRTQASHTAEEASGEVRRRQEHAAAQARAYVERLSSSISALLERLETIEGECNALTASLRGDTERLRGELTALEDELGGANAGSEPVEAAPPVALPEPAPIAADVSEPVTAPVAAPEPAPAAADLSDLQAEYSRGTAKIGDEPPEEVPAAAAPGEQTSAAGSSDDTEGARLIALNMALNGTPREETERYLAENYDLADRRGLLDEVYASVQG